MRDAAARFWISIRALLSLILFIGVGIAALRGATAIWASVMILAALGAICTATVGRGPDPWGRPPRMAGVRRLRLGLFPALPEPLGGRVWPRPGPLPDEGRQTGSCSRSMRRWSRCPSGGQEEFLVFMGMGKNRSFYHGVFHALMTGLFASIGAVASRILVSVRSDADGDPRAG